MSIFDFRKKPALTSTAADTNDSPQTSIHYDKALIPRLCEEHQRLLNDYHQIQQTLITKSYGKIPGLLEKFRAVLLDHMLVENTKLYTYLRQQLSDDSSTTGLINAFAQEMDDIGHDIMQFTHAYAKHEIDDDNGKMFKQKLDKIGAKLMARILREESTLYPIYIPQYPPKSGV